MGGPQNFVTPAPASCFAHGTEGCAHGTLANIKTDHAPRATPDSPGEQKVDGDMATTKIATQNSEKMVSFIFARLNSSFWIDLTTYLQNAKCENYLRNPF